MTNTRFNSIACVLLLAGSTEAFAPGLRTVTSARSLTITSTSRSSPRLFASSSVLPENGNKDEVQRLRDMAAKLRQEAATLEADQKKAFAQAAEQIFRRFDMNKDGKIDVAELKDGLEKVLKIDVPDKRAEQLVQAFDTNQDGALQLEEFSGAGVDGLRNKLDAIVREERNQARAKAKAVQTQAETAKIAEMQMELVNDKAPTATDKIVSVLPYLFPLIDGLQFARFFIEGNPDSPLATAALIAYGLYRSIPLSGFLSFVTLNFLSSNPKLNKLVRFNMQQAVYLDIALFAPALLVALGAGLLTQLGVQIPASAAELGSDAMFLTLLGTIGYTSISSLLGQVPDKLPFISDRVQNGMITPDMFDVEGRFSPFDEEGNLKETKKDSDDENKRK